MARYFRLPFAENGDKNTVPDETPNSIVSYSSGYTQDYQRDPRTDPLARRPERDFLNQVLFDITSTLQLYYQTGVPPFITSALNGGSAFSYPLGARTLVSNRIYENTTANNTNSPPGTGWVLVDVSGNDARYFTRTAADNRFLRVANNLSDVTAATARTNLGLGSSATLNAGTAAGNLPRNSDLGTASLVDTGTSSANVPTITQADGRYLQKSNNLSDVTAATARTNLELGTSAVRNTTNDSTSTSETLVATARALSGIRVRAAVLTADSGSRPPFTDILDPSNLTNLSARIRVAGLYIVCYINSRGTSRASSRFVSRLRVNGNDVATTDIALDDFNANQLVGFWTGNLALNDALSVATSGGNRSTGRAELLIIKIGN